MNEGKFKQVIEAKSVPTFWGQTKTGSYSKSCSRELERNKKGQTPKMFLTGKC